MTAIERWHQALSEAVDAGFVSRLVCATHDGVPTTEAEQEEWEEGFDPCAFVVRLWDDVEQGPS